MENNKFTAILKNKKLMIVLAVLLVVVIAAVIAVISISVEQAKHPLEGTFTANIGEEFAVESSYTFDGSRATNTYFDGTESITVEYTYEVKGNSGDRVIELTRVENNEKSTYSFAVVTDKDGNTTAVIINTLWYYKR